MKDKNKKHNTENQDKPVGPENEDVPDVKAESDDAKSVSESEAQGKSADLKAETSGKEGNDEKYLRLMADFDNFRKRTIRERTELYQRANEDIIEEILPVLDHLDLALKSAAENNVVAGVIDGFRLVAEQLLSALRKSGLTVLDVAEGSQFDPTLHEAISHLPSENIPENAVITQIRRGYLLGGRVLRATQVVVSRGSQSDGGQENVEPVISSEGK